MRVLRTNAKIVAVCPPTPKDTVFPRIRAGKVMLSTAGNELDVIKLAFGDANSLFPRWCCRKYPTADWLVG